MFNITKEIYFYIFLSQQCHATDRVTRTRTSYLRPASEIKENRAFIVFVFSF